MRKIAVIIGLVLVISCFAFADTVVLKNGRRLHGKIVSENDREVVIELARLGSITVRRQQIKEIIKNKRTGPIAPKPSEPEKPKDPSKPEKPEQKPDSSEKTGTPARDPAPQTARPREKLQDAPFLHMALSVNFRKEKMDKVLEKISKDTGITIELSKEAKERKKELGHDKLKADVYQDTPKLKQDKAGVKSPVGSN